MIAERDKIPHNLTVICHSSNVILALFIGFQQWEINCSA